MVEGMCAIVDPISLTLNNRRNQALWKAMQELLMLDTGQEYLVGLVDCQMVVKPNVFQYQPFSSPNFLLLFFG